MRNLLDYMKAHYGELLEAVDMEIERESYIEYTNEKLPEEILGRRKLALLNFVGAILSLTPNQEEAGSIIVSGEFCDFPEDDDTETYIAPSVYRMEDLKKYRPKTEIFGLDVNALSNEEVNQWLDWIKEQPYLTSYGYDFSPWEDWLGLMVDEESMERHGIARSLAGILLEMTFNGVTREDQEERRDELRALADELDELILQMPEEEQKKHLHSLDELREEIGWKDERTQEEKDADMNRLRREMLKNCIMTEQNLQSVCNSLA